MRYINTYESRLNFFRKKTKEEPVTPVKANKTSDEIVSEFQTLLDGAFTRGYSKITDDVKLWYHYLESIFQSDTISFKFKINSNEIDFKAPSCIEPITTIKIGLRYDRDTSKGIIVKSFSIDATSIIKWNSDEPHQIVSTNKKGCKFEIKKTWHTTSTKNVFAAYSEERYDTHHLINELEYKIKTSTQEVIKKHFDFINHYVGLDAHNLRINTKIEDIKDDLDQVRQCLADIEDLSKQTIIKLSDKEIVDGKIISKNAIIACSFEIDDLKTSPVSGGLNINFNSKTIKLFDYLAEAKNRISDIFEDAQFDIDISNGKIILFINIPL